MTKNSVPDTSQENAENPLAQLEKALAEAKEKYRLIEEVELPLTISGYKISHGTDRGLRERGCWVMVRPCAKEYQDKTYLGIYLGDLPIDIIGLIDNKTNELSLTFHRNPAIYVPDLKCIIYGFESWWGPINHPDDLKQITDADIQNIWYVKILKELTEEEHAEVRE